MIRWGRLAFLLTPLILIWAGTHFFLDRGIKSAIETAGTTAVGARVDVANVRTRFWRLSATVNGLAVTDPDHPMTNSIDIGTIRMNVQLKPLFWKKVIIDQAEILNVRTGTPRKSSGALPKKNPSTKEPPSAIEEKAKELASASLENLKEAYDPTKLVAPENLASYQKALAERDRLTNLADSWKTRTQKWDTQGLSQRAKEFAAKVKDEKFSGMEGIQKAQSLIKEGERLHKELSAAQKELKSAGGDLTKEVNEAKTTLKEVERLRRQDIDRAIAQIKSGFSTEGMTKGLLGPEWFVKLEKILGWIGAARRLSGGDDKASGPPPAPVRHGRDIPFPFHHRWPTFHLVRAALSGETPGNLNYTGTLSDVSSDPKGLGEPMQLELAGRAGERALTLSAVLDLTTDTPKETIKADYAGLPLSGMKLGSLGGGPVSISGGQGAVKANLLVRGNDLSGTMNLEALGLKVAPLSAEKKDRVTLVLNSLLQGITEAKIGIGVSGTIKSPQFTLNSSIDNQLRGALKGAADQQTAQLRADLEKQINALVGKETEKLSALVDKNAVSALEKLNLSDKDLVDVQEKIKKAMDDLAKSGTQGIKLPDLKGLFKKR
jgi:uncharacterized protein (TIGR03545 family)